MVAIAWPPVTPRQGLASNGAELGATFFLTEDTAVPRVGCDAISTYRFGSGVVESGPTIVSPGRLAVSRDGLVAAATQSNGAGPFIYLWRNTESEWRATEWLLPDVATFGGVAVAVAESTGSVFVATSAKTGAEMRNTAPYGLERYRLPTSTGPLVEGGLREAFVPLDSLAVLVNLADSETSVHVLLESDEVATFRSHDLVETAARIRVAAFSPLPNEVHVRGPEQRAAATTDGARYWIRNGGVGDNIDVVDLRTRTSRRIALGSGGEYVGGLSFNRALGSNHGLLAVNHGDRVGVYDIDLYAGEVSRRGEVATGGRVAVRGRDITGPKASVAWSGDGELIMAATSGTEESQFALVHVAGQGKSLAVVDRVFPCAYHFAGQPGFPNDVVAVPPSIHAVYAPLVGVGDQPERALRGTGPH